MTTVSQIQDSGTLPLPSTPVYAATPTFVCFQHTDINTEPYVWPYGGSSTVLANINTTGNSAPSSFGSDGQGRICLAATTPASGRELWVTDGTPGGTVMVNDAVPGADSSNPEPMPMRQGQPQIFYRVERTSTPGIGINLWHANLTNLGANVTKLVAQGVHGWMMPTVASPTELGFFLPASGSTWYLWKAEEKGISAVRLSSANFTAVDRI